MDDTLSQVRRRLNGADSVVVLTGAGISAESGVPTFRGTDGLWKNYRAEELATPEAFSRDPELVWQWYAWRRSLIAGAEPNPAHFALVEIEKRSKEFTLITQNVDGLHALAGSSNIIEMHGSIWKVRCIGCGLEREAGREDNSITEELPPKCGCGALLRPGVVWFGEPLDPGVISAVFKAVGSADLMLVIGTSSVVQPAASLATASAEAGAYVVDINIESRPANGIADVSLIGRAGEVLPALLQG